MRLWPAVRLFDAALMAATGLLVDLASSKGIVCAQRSHGAARELPPPRPGLLLLLLLLLLLCLSPPLPPPAALAEEAAGASALGGLLNGLLRLDAAPAAAAPKVWLVAAWLLRMECVCCATPAGKRSCRPSAYGG